MSPNNGSWKRMSLKVIPDVGRLWLGRLQGGSQVLLAARRSERKERGEEQEKTTVD
jgi:hypothetical protein